MGEGAKDDIQILFIIYITQQTIKATGESWARRAKEILFLDDDDDEEEEIK